MYVFTFMYMTMLGFLVLRYTTTKLIHYVSNPTLLMEKMGMMMNF